MGAARLSLAALLLAIVAPLAAAGAAAGGALPFIEDDYPKARALARSKKLPIFVEAWAPW
jgi:hypothetical protein